MSEFDGPQNAESAKDYKQKILTQEYARMTRENQAAWSDFDRSGYDHIVALETNYSLYEAVEPAFAAMQRARMVKEMAPGLFPPQVLPGYGDVPIPNGSDIVFQFTYAEGGFMQLRNMPREDGTTIPVLLECHKTKSGYDPISMVLLSDVGNDKVQNWYQDEYLPDIRVGQQLFEHVGVSWDVIQTVSPEDKRAMLATWKELNGLPETEGQSAPVAPTSESPTESTEQITPADFKTLDKARKKFVKAVLPGAQFLQNSRQRDLAHVESEYIEELKKMVNQNPDAVDKICINERLLRLTALSNQLKVRTRVDRAMQVGPAALMVPVGAGAGAAAGFSFAPDRPIASVIGALVGAVSGWSLQRSFSHDFSRKMERMSLFPGPKSDSINPRDIAAQFQQEKLIAQRNADISSKPL
jgi:hypothetical protein